MWGLGVGVYLMEGVPKVREGYNQPDRAMVTPVDISAWIISILAVVVATPRLGREHGNQGLILTAAVAPCRGSERFMSRRRDLT